MVNINMKNSWSYFNNMTRMNGLQKAAKGEYAAQVYVISQKIKKKIIKYDYINQEYLIDIIDKWSNKRIFLFCQKYIDKKDCWEKMTRKTFYEAINEINNIKLSQIKINI